MLLQRIAKKPRPLKSPVSRLGDMTEYKEIIIALIAVFGAVIPYLLQKNKEA